MMKRLVSLLLALTLLMCAASLATAEGAPAYDGSHSGPYVQALRKPHLTIPPIYLTSAKETGTISLKGAERSCSAE